MAIDKVVLRITDNPVSIEIPDAPGPEKKGTGNPQTPVLGPSFRPLSQDEFDDKSGPDLNAEENCPYGPELNQTDHRNREKKSRRNHNLPGGPEIKAREIGDYEVRGNQEHRGVIEDLPHKTRGGMIKPGHEAQNDRKPPEEPEVRIGVLARIQENNNPHDHVSEV